jgi:hypothetical protein
MLSESATKSSSDNIIPDCSVRKRTYIQTMRRLIPTGCNAFVDFAAVLTVMLCPRLTATDTKASQPATTAQHDLTAYSRDNI